MTQPLSQRIQYHPDPRDLSTADRNVLSRLKLILERVDFKGRTVLDLGCSGGFFSFALAESARKVIAVDGDAAIIERNRKLQSELGARNIEFLHANITKEILDHIGPVDITLLMSVYHHMLTISDAYDWNQGIDKKKTDGMIDKLNQQTNTLVFEIGYPNEGYEWCARLPRYEPNWDTYVLDNVFRGFYRSVEVEAPAIEKSWINDNIIAKLSSSYKQDNIVISKLKSFFNFDSRDYRKIYIGKK